MKSYPLVLVIVASVLIIAAYVSLEPSGLFRSPSRISEPNPIPIEPVKPINENTLKFTLTVDKIPIIKETEEHTKVTLEGFDVISEEGVPSLPEKIFNYILPEGKKFKEVKIVDIITSEQIIKKQIESIPTSIPTCSECIGGVCEIPEMSTQSGDVIYSSDLLYPSEPVRFVSENSVGGRNIISVIFSPVQYNPIKNKLVLTESIEFEIVLEDDKLKTIYNDRVKTLIPLVENKELIENTQDKSRSGVEYYNEDSPADYIIITNDELKPSYEPLAEWKRQKGLNTKIVTIDEVYEYVGAIPELSPRDNAEKLRFYIRDFYNNEELAWVLLGGDEDVLPIRYCIIGTVATSNVLSGEYSVKAMLGNWDLKQDLNLEPDTVYNLSYWGKRDELNFNSSLIIGVNQGEGGVPSEIILNCGNNVSSEWTKKTCIFTTGSSAENLSLYINIFVGEMIYPQYYVFIDDVSLVKLETDENLINNPGFEDITDGGNASWNNYVHNELFSSSASFPGLGSQHITDLYFSDMDGDWNLDEDLFWGEDTVDGADYGSDVFVSRIPLKDVEDTEAIVSKMVQYEKNPGNGNSDYVLDAILFGSDQMIGPIFVPSQPEEVAEYIPDNFNKDFNSLNEQLSGNDSNPVFPSGQEIIDSLGRGYGIVAYFAHGSPIGFIAKSSGYNTPPKSYVVSDIGESEDYFSIDNLHNFDKPSFVTTVSCSNAAFDTDKIPGAEGFLEPYVVESWLKQPGSGAFAFLGNVRAGSVFFSYKSTKKFFEYAFDSNLQSIAVALANTKSNFLSYYYRDHIYTFNLYGDPETKLYSEIPEKLKQEASGDANNFIVDVSLNEFPVDGAMVTITNSLGEYLKSETDSSGQTSFDLNDFTLGFDNLMITSWKYNSIPVQIDNCVLPVGEEICDDIDNNCDGNIDIDNSDCLCSSKNGICIEMSVSCSSLSDPSNARVYYVDASGPENTCVGDEVDVYKHCCIPRTNTPGDR